MFTSKERVRHIDGFCERNKEPSSLREGQKGLKAMMYFPPFTHVTHSLAPILQSFSSKKELGHPDLFVLIVLEEMIIQTQIRR